ncbi:pilus assembly protein PilO [Hydrogenivirga caldilitoris]|uniref:Pilus assembly protein PilO n=1 Tax=Hydrogenivirga caldilitoris TaxID=246264 RepID=A0A497XQ45_9AQUI|nr:type 4a pilus biogenesis protein PilO [Hydrogenivirga caldilitoris]RLJ71018.1 pilus assembly protein PilO [Hydrogenivirga caldilitoris]
MPSIKEQWEATPLWQKAVVSVALPLVAIGAVWFYVISPDMEKKDKLLKEKDQLNQEIARYKRLIRPDALKSLEEQLEKLKKEEEVKKQELEKVVGKIPTQEEIEKVFGEINDIAASKELIITRISISPPRTQSLELVESEGKKFVKTAAQPQQQQKRRGRAPQKQAQPVAERGVPVTTMEVSMNLEGTTENLYSFLEAIYKRGLVSYPKSLSIKPVSGKGTVEAAVTIDVILQK